MSNQLRAEGMVIDLATLREKRQLQRSLDDYQEYLGGLGIGQMEGEAQHLLEEFSGQNFGPDFMDRVQLLLSELAQRADGNFQHAILRLRGQLPPTL